MAEQLGRELDNALAHLADGARDAFPAVFATAWPAVLRYCRVVLRDAADAEDAAQQALLKVFAQASDYDTTRPALPWILAIATWECRSVLTRRRRQRGVPVEAIVSTAAGVSSPGDDAEVKELKRAVDSVMALMPERERSILTAAFWEQLDDGNARDAVFRKRKQRALERFRRLWRKTHGS